jgi:beta-fructofuranosidase
MFSVLMLGDYHQRRFTPQQIVKADYGDRYFYAPQTLRDALGRRIVFGWIGEGRNEQAQRERGWSGVMSLPRELTLGSDGQPRWRAIAELEQLRGAHLSMEAITAHAGDLVELPTVRGDVLELIVTLAIDPDASGGLLLRRSPDGDEQTGIFYDAARGELLIDRSRSSLAHDLDVTPQRAPLALEGGEPLRLRIFLDRSVIEVFANERVAMTSRIYPTRPDSQGVALTALSGETWIERLDGWQLSL